MGVRDVAQGSDVDERLAALVTNVNAVKAIASAVEGTIGSKGLDTMLVDRFGDVTITNDGITILTTMEVGHPAAQMVINTARAQEKEMGDGTTTATIIAGALLSEGLNHATRGVPVTRIIEGVRFGVERARAELNARAHPIEGLDDPRLRQVALVAGRGHEDVADLVVEAASLVGRDTLLDPSFRLADTVAARDGAENEVFMGVVIDKEPLKHPDPPVVSEVRLLVVDDALEPEQLEEEALATEAGFTRYMELQRRFQATLAMLVELGVNVVFVSRGVAPVAEEFLCDAGVTVVSRVSRRDWRRVAELTGASPIKRTGLAREADRLTQHLGTADRLVYDRRLKNLRIQGGAGRPLATVLVGASTREVVGERERIARDAASAVQAAVRGGTVAGGGAVELAVGRAVAESRNEVRGMASFGVDCVVEALKRPFAQIVANAGFNPLEKIGDVLAAQAAERSDSLAIDCDTGEIADMAKLGVVDPAPVKEHAIRAAGEIAQAILRIDTIIKKRTGPDGSDLHTSGGDRHGPTPGQT